MKDKTKELHGLMKLPAEALLKIAEDEIRQLKIEIGKYKSEVQHLESQISELKSSNDVNREARILARKEVLYQELKNRNHVLSKDMRKLQNANKDLIIRLLKHENNNS
jgi:flagellar biosynthesis chaperone FliJ